MVRTHALHSETRPELARILAIAAALAVHVLAFLLLLIPMATPLMQVQLDRGKPQIIFLEPKPPIIEPVTVTQPTPQVQSPVPARIARAVQPPQPAPVIAEGGSLATSPPVPQMEGGVDTLSVSAGPIASSTLAYLVTPPPPYPRATALAGIQGNVLLKVLVDVDGRPLQVAIEQSSGNRLLDRTARDYVLRHWRFQPAMQDGRAVQAYGLVPIAFSMQ